MNTKLLLTLPKKKAKVKLVHEAHIGHVPGFRATGVHAGLKRQTRDILLLVSDRDATAAGVFTQNAVVAAPVVLSRQVAARGRARAIVGNSGNANAVTGEQGLRDAKRMQELASQLLDVPADEVFVSSTGIIGQLMPMEKLEKGLREAAKLVVDAKPNGAAAEAIMTTDTVPKEIVVVVETPKGAFHLGAIAKGSGMIAPNMATMLAFLATDAAVDAATLQECLAATVDDTYNMVSVDHDTSTNDMALALANGASGLRVGKEVPVDVFRAAMHAVNLHLAKAIARDGEGATKLLVVHVAGAASPHDARRAAKAVIDSPLVKTAVQGADPNWGRVLAAVGYSGAKVDPARVSLKLGNAATQTDVLSAGEPLAFDRNGVRALMLGDEVHVRVDLGLGEAEATAYGCDLTREYVDFNAHYTT